MISRFDLPPIPDSVLGRLDPRWKLAAIVPAIGFVLALRGPLCLSLAFGASLLLALLGRIPARRLLVRLGVVALLLLPFAGCLPFLRAGTGPWWVLAFQLYL